MHPSIHPSILHHIIDNEELHNQVRKEKLA